ncbi:MAG: helix-turn-helix domain-containing protein [Steroidobacteraceae bacterium]
MGERAGHIRSIARALGLLHAMNEKQPCTIAELQATTRLPKPTVFRILTTLEDEGYVRNEGGLGRYRVTEKTRRLSAGYGEKSLLIDIGAPLLLTVTRSIKWPLALGTLDRDAIVVRYSTMPYSPLAVQATTLGHRLPLLETAMGQSYLAFCDVSEQRILCDLLLASAIDDRGVAGESITGEMIESLISQVRRRGYGLRLPRASGGSATVAVPVLREAQILGVLSMTTFGNLMNEKLLATYLPVLRETACNIVEAIDAHNEALEPAMVAR